MTPLRCLAFSVFFAALLLTATKTANACLCGPRPAVLEPLEQVRAEIPKGQYVLVANPDGKPSSREPFPKIFYPNVTERERALVIEIKPGEKLANLDIVIPSWRKPL